MSLPPRTRWRVHFLVFTSAAATLIVLWYASAERTLTNFLAISVPLLVLVYAAAVAGVTAWGHIPTGAEGDIANAFGPRLGALLSLAASAWLTFVGVALGWAGDWAFGTFCIVLGIVFLVATFPGRLSWLRVAVATVGLVAASVLFVLRG